MSPYGQYFYFKAILQSKADLTAPEKSPYSEFASLHVGSTYLLVLRVWDSAFCTIGFPLLEFSDCLIRRHSGVGAHIMSELNRRPLPALRNALLPLGLWSWAPWGLLWRSLASSTIHTFSMSLATFSCRLARSELRMKLRRSLWSTVHAWPLRSAERSNISL